MQHRYRIQRIQWTSVYPGEATSLRWRFAGIVTVEDNDPLSALVCFALRQGIPYENVTLGTFTMDVAGGGTYKAEWVESFEDVFEGLEVPQ